MSKKIVFSFFIICMMLTSCSIFTKPPLSVFNGFLKACNAKDFATGETYVTENALQTASQYNVCENYMPDGYFRVTGTSRSPLRLP